MTMAVSQPSRLLGPDFARGFALLGIAIANATVYWCMLAATPENAVQTKAGLIVDNSLWDKIAIFIGTLFVHVRGLPMFATLLGYGIGMIYLRQQRRGLTLSDNQKILLRRYGFLALIGLVHLLFLFFGDIMLYYGAIALLVIAMAKLSDKQILTIGAICFGIGVVLSFSVIYFFPQFSNGFDGSTGSYVKDQLVMGGIILIALPFQLAFAGLMVIPLIMLGFIAGRREVFSHPEQYAPQMRIAMIVTAMVILVIGVPFGLSATGVIDNPLLYYALNSSLGMMTGPGLVAVMFWAASMLEQRGLNNILPVRMIVALGRLSMTGYVMQSVLFGIFVTSYGLGFGAGAGAMTVTLIAAGVWLVTVLFAFAWSHLGKPGPLEMLHRHLSYKQQPQPQAPKQVSQPENTLPTSQ